MAGHGFGNSQLVGREDEQARLEASTEPTNPSRVLLVVGPGGIGKTSLLRSYSNDCTTRGEPVGWGIAGEWEGTPGLWPWYEALSEIDPEQDVLAVGASVTPSSPDMAELFRAIARWMARRGSETPFVLIIEDLHEADPTAIALLSYLSRRPALPGVTIIASTRPGNPTIDALRCQRLPLEGLCVESILTLSQAMGRPIDERTANELFQRTNGNPLFVQRLLEHGSLGPDGTVPSDVAALIQQQLASAPQQAQPAMRALSVLGSAPLDMLQRMTNGHPVGPLLSEVSSDILSVSDRSSTSVNNESIVAFRHSLIREVMYQGLDPAERFALHARAADVLRSLDASPIALAHHLSRAASTSRGKEAAEAARAAARIERSNGAIREAAQHFRLAVDLLTDLGEANELAATTIEEAEVLAQLGRASEAEQRLIEVANLAAEHTPTLRRRLVRTYGRLRWLEEPNPSTLDASRLMSIAEEWLEPDQNDADAAVFYTAMATAGDIRGGGLEDVDSADKALAAARKSKNPLLVAEAHLARRRALSVHPGRTKERRIDADEALRLGTQLADHELVIRANRLALTDALAAADRERVTILLSSDPISVAGRVQQALASSTVAALEGRYAAADDVLDETLKELGYLDIDAPALEFSRIAYAWDQGTLPETLAIYEPLLPTIADPALRSAVSIAKLLSGQHDVAATLVEETLDILGTGEPTVLWALSMAMVAETAAAIDHPSVARIYEELRPYAGECVLSATSAAAWCGAFDRVLGLLALRLGQSNQAVQHLTASVVIHERMNAKPWLARSRAGLAAALRQQGRTAEAAEQQSLAVALAESINMPTAVLLLERFDDRITAEVETHDSPVAGRQNESPLNDDLPEIEPTNAILPQTSDIGPGKRNTAVASLIREGDVWRIGVGENLHLLRHSNGLEYLQLLVQHARRDWHALDLYSTISKSAGVSEASVGAPLDDAARKAYQARYVELSAALDEATLNADLGRADSCQQEIDELERELLGAFGLGGRPRQGGDSTEKARINVRRAISRSISRIAEVSPTLSSHLDRSIRTGRFCRYDPGPNPRLTWSTNRSDNRSG